MNRILIVEDEDVIRSALRKLLQHNGYQVSDVASVEEAQLQDLGHFNLIISDLRLPGLPGTELIRLATQTPVLIMTSYASLRSAVDAMKLGAVDYIAKPFDHEEMLDAVRAILARRRPLAADTPTEREAELPRDATSDPAELMYGQCEAMQKVFNLIRKVAPTDTTVLINGESGTGKELAARALHLLSPRARAPLISVNCAAIPETLIESELFGHEKGAFTGAVSARNGLIEAADGGTLFLDEIGEFPVEAQARLLRVLQEGEIRRIGSTQSRQVDIRLIAATHRNLKAMTRTGEFREDLYYRLNVMQLRMPPLRERDDDVIGLAQRFLKRVGKRLGKESASLTNDALNAIRRYNWPGNVRELENAIERALILSDNQQITAELLDLDMDLHDVRIPPGLIAADETAEARARSNTQDLSLEDYFQHFVLENQDKMSETELAQKLGISRKSLWERRQRLGIPRRKGGTTP
ncbi:MAG: sigma-54 dependent transcriptional regulator [Gammaproteobacteria bacterium]|nr:sigma-54 dependent transcriptional regulator [Gammaproteobacteria bacterium]